MLAHVRGVENPAAHYLSRLKIRLEDRIQLNLTDSTPVLQVEIEIACETPKQEEDETDYYPQDKADGNV